MIHTAHFAKYEPTHTKLLFFNRDFPEHSLYTTPVFFTSDWLNEYWDTLEVDDYRFVYMGPKGSWCDKINVDKNPEYGLFVIIYIKNELSDALS